MATHIAPADLAAMKAHPGQNYSTQLIISTGVCVPIALACVVLRFAARYIGSVRVGIDDWLLLVGFVFSTAFSLTLTIMVQWGFGKHVIFVPAQNFVKLGQGGFSALVVLPLATWCIKVSILFMLWRIFPLHGFKKVLYVCGALFTALAIAHFFATLFECLPVGAQFGPKHHTCINLDALFSAVSCVNAGFDFVILALPLPIIFTLHTNLQRKLQTAAIFGVGLFACAASIIRAVYAAADKPTDETYWNALAGAWAVVEINVAVICACLPNFGPLFRRIQHGRQTTPRPYYFGSASNALDTKASVSTKSGSRASESKQTVGSDEWALYNDDHVRKSARVVGDTQPVPPELRDTRSTANAL